MKVLHVIPSLSRLRGGASKAAIDMVKALRDVGVDAEIATTNDDGRGELDVTLNELIQFEGVPVRFFKRFSPKGDNVISHALREFAYSADFRRWLKQHIHDYKIVHAHALFSFTSSYCMYMARSKGVKYLAHPIGSLETWSLTQSSMRKKIFLALVDRSNLTEANYVHFTAASEHQQALLVAPKLRPLVIPLGLELPGTVADARARICSKFELDENATILLFLGRLHAKKGLELLFDAIAELSHLNIQLLVAGDGEHAYVEGLQSKALNLGSENRIQFLGHVDGELKIHLIQGADIFALTSYSENFGIAALEAMANGTAVLLSKDVALSAAVHPNKLGGVCETSKESVATTLSDLLSDPHELQQKGQRGREYVSQNHHWPELARRLKSAYYGA